MNKAAIKAELRRSACEDEIPFMGIGDSAWDEARQWKDHGRFLYELNPDDLHTFFLLVAEAM